MRKNNGYEMMDQIKICFNGDKEVSKAVQGHKEYIMHETLAVSVEEVTDMDLEKQDLNEHETGIKIERI